MLRVLKITTVLAALLVAIPAILGMMLLQSKPIVRSMSAPTSNDVVGARALAQASRQAAGPLVATETQLNSVIRLVSRFMPGFRGELMVARTDVEGKVSIPVPYSGETLWLNISATMPEFNQSLSLSSVMLGRISLPPSLALEIGRRVANLVIGEGFGDRLVKAASSMVIEEDRLILDTGFNRVGRDGIMLELLGTLRGSELPSPDEIDRYYKMIRKAMDNGVLPNEGSYFPYLQFTLEAALEGSRTEGGPNAFTSAMFALTYACGAKDFSLVVGEILGGDQVTGQNWTTDCSKLTLNGRIDTRRHFTTAAALQAASNRGFSIIVGELKELYDIVKSGGFDFTDIAANNSGIRMAHRFMSSPLRSWPTLLERLRSEREVIISFDDIPQIMLEQQFVASIGTIDSHEYYTMIDRIEAKIDKLPLHLR